MACSALAQASNFSSMSVIVATNCMCITAKDAERQWQGLHPQCQGFLNVGLELGTTAHEPAGMHWHTSASGCEPWPD